MPTRWAPLCAASLLPTVASLVDYSSLAGMPTSLAQHAATFAYCAATLPERYDDDDGCEQLDARALESTTALMRLLGDSDARFATFAGGCFWGLELALQRTPGVLATAAGYTQGHTEFPSYKEVCSEATGHTESVLLLYDRDVVSYSALAELLFDRIGDPTMLNRVGNDRGPQYRTGMYWHSDEQAAEARAAFDCEAKTWRS